jgi:type IV pilus assembly protein PilC
MTTLWKWKAVDEQGNIRAGLINAEGKAAVIQRLRSRNLYPIRLRKAAFNGLRLWRQSCGAQKYWARTARKLGTLMEAGVPMLIIVGMMQKGENNLFRKNQWQEI